MNRSIPAWAGEPEPSSPRITAFTVYPRVGGGTLRGGWSPAPGRGLSPRGRGNPNPFPVLRRQVRSIPAWAGEPSSPPQPLKEDTVYPRVGGGTAPGARPPRQATGLSPRGWGNHREDMPHELPQGSIPAWAGEPCGARRGCLRSGVYPRVGGGTSPDATLCVYHWGLSPRGRGNPLKIPTAWASIRSIPAWAGEPLPRVNRRVKREVYPRVGGGTNGAFDAIDQNRGLSPRGRGNRLKRGQAST